MQVYEAENKLKRERYKIRASRSTINMKKKEIIINHNHYLRGDLIFGPRAAIET